MNVSGALSTYAYQTTLAQSGSQAQAVTRALATGQSQAADTSALLASAGSGDATAVLAGDAAGQALTTLAYSAASSAGNGPEAVQALLATLGGSASSLVPVASSSPLAPAAYAPGSTEALARYAYDQSQNQKQSAAQDAAVARQSLMSTGLNLLA